MKKKYGVIALAAILLIYAAGVIVRSRQGVAVVITNSTPVSLNDLTLTLEPQHARLSVADLPSGSTKRLWIKPASESHLVLALIDSSGRKRGQIIGGYLESGYCGTIKVVITPGEIKSDEDVNVIFCLSSWSGPL